MRLTGNTDPVLTNTSTSLASALNPSTAGGSVSLTATVSIATNLGDVQFKDGGVNVGQRVPVIDGVATVTLPAVAAGDHTYTAFYSGTLDTGGSTSPVLAQAVEGQADASQSLDCPATATPDAQIVCTLTTANAGSGPAQVLSLDLPLPAGTTFQGASVPGWSCMSPSLGAPGTLSCGRTVLAAGASSAITVAIGVPAAVAPGPLALTASLTADSDDLNPANNTVTDTFNVLAATGTAVTSSANPVTAGDAVSFTATVSEAQPGTPTGTVQFKVGGTDLGPPVALTAAGTATLTTAALAAGSHSIMALYSGDSAFLTSTSSALSQSISTPPEATPGPAATPSPTPGPSDAGGQGGPAVDPGIRFAGVQKRVTLSSKGAFGLRFGATRAVPLNVDVTALVPGSKKQGKRKATKARTVKLYAGRGVAADGKGNVAVRVTLSKALQRKLPKSRKTFAGTLTVKASGRTFTHKFTFVRAKTKAKKQQGALSRAAARRARTATARSGRPGLSG